MSLLWLIHTHVEILLFIDSSKFSITVYILYMIILIGFSPYRVNSSICSCMGFALRFIISLLLLSCLLPYPGHVKVNSACCWLIDKFSYEQKNGWNKCQGLWTRTQKILLYILCECSSSSGLITATRTFTFTPNENIKSDSVENTATCRTGSCEGKKGSKPALMFI